MIKTFRGQLTDGQQERIRLEHRDGKVGYRIKKFQGISSQPGQLDLETVLKVYSIEQTAVDGEVDFNEQTMLAVCYFKDYGTNDNQPSPQTIIFDGVVFNQDIFITHSEVRSNKTSNYYLELETVSLDDVEATAVILKNFRNTNTVV